jgi:hypothetical protein
MLMETMMDGGMCGPGRWDRDGRISFGSNMPAFARRKKKLRTQDTCQPHNPLSDTAQNHPIESRIWPFRQNAKQDHNIKMNNKSFENVVKFINLATAVENESYFHGEFKGRRTFQNACYNRFRTFIFRSVSMEQYPS